MIGSDSFIRTFLQPSPDVTTIPLSFLHPFTQPTQTHHPTNPQTPHPTDVQIASDRTSPRQPFIRDHGIPELVTDNPSINPTLEVTPLTRDPSSISDYEADNLQLVDLIVRSSTEIEKRSQTELLDTVGNHGNLLEVGNHGNLLEVGNHGNLLNVSNVNKSVSIESDSVFSNEACYHGNEACYHGNEACYHGNEACYHGNKVLTFSREVFDVMYRTVYPELSLSGLEAHVFIVHRQSGLGTDNAPLGNHGNNATLGNHGNNATLGNHGNNATLGNHGSEQSFSLGSMIGRFDFITNTLSISINRNLEPLEDSINGLCFVNNLYGEAVNANVVRAVLGCVEGYSFGFTMFYNVLSDGEPSLECFDAKGMPMVFDLV